MIAVFVGKNPIRSEGGFRLSSAYRSRAGSKASHRSAVSRYGSECSDTRGVGGILVIHRFKSGCERPAADE